MQSNNILGLFQSACKPSLCDCRRVQRFLWNRCLIKLGLCLGRLKSDFFFFLEGVEINRYNSPGQLLVQSDHQSPQNVIFSCRWLVRENWASCSGSVPRAGWWGARGMERHQLSLSLLCTPPALLISKLCLSRFFIKWNDVWAGREVAIQLSSLMRTQTNQ